MSPEAKFIRSPSWYVWLDALAWYFKEGPDPLPFLKR